MAQKSCSLVAFGKALSACHVEGKNSLSLNWVDDIIDGFPGGVDPVQFVWLVEPLASTANLLIDRDGKPKIWLPQCSCKYWRSSSYSPERLRARRDRLRRCSCRSLDPCLQT